MKITTEMAAHIAALSRLKLSEEEAGRMAGELEQILSYMDVLDGLDTSGAEPMSHIVPLKNVLREDETAGQSTYIREHPDNQGRSPSY